MSVLLPRLSPFRCIIFLGLLICLFSCSTARHIESEQDKEVHKRLGLNYDRKDNFILYKEAASWLYVPHVDGGSSRNGTDCSFLVYSIYKAVYNKILERNSAAILDKNCRRIGRHRLQEGDLVFFNTGSRLGSYITHVGIYLKENKFLHASTLKGVHVSDLEENYYRKAWVCGGRVK